MCKVITRDVPIGFNRLKILNWDYIGLSESESLSLHFLFSASAVAIAILVHYSDEEKAFRWKKMFSDIEHLGAFNVERIFIFFKR